MRRIILEIDAGERLCAGCALWNQDGVCPAFPKELRWNEALSDTYRCDECLDAENLFMDLKAE